ncbi:MAG: hypothetical protein ACXAD7_12980 [Candidatus Kariarchaeaceae archaeon]|jgi:hypothetical protein
MDYQRIKSVNRIVCTIGIISLLLLVPANKVITAQTTPNITEIGVEDGDSFTFVLEKYDNDWQTKLIGNPVAKYEGFDVKTTGELFYLLEGDEFTITITNATPHIVDDHYGDFFRDYGIEGEIQASDETYPVELMLGYIRSGGSMFTYTDWDSWETQLSYDFEVEISSKEGLVREGGEFSLTYSILNQSDKFTIISDYHMDGTSQTIDDVKEIVYDKTTGVLLLLYHKQSVLTLNTGDTFDIEMIIRNVEYNETISYTQGQGNEISLPSFYFGTTLISLFFISVTMIRPLVKKKT